MVILIHAMKFRSIPADHRDDREVLVVAMRLTSCWTARMSLVAGKGEWNRVAESGRVVKEWAARQLFPEFQQIAYESI